jgi:hypothetical protein
MPLLNNLVDGIIKPEVNTNSDNITMSEKSGNTNNIDLSTTYSPTFNIHLPPMEEAAILRIVKEILQTTAPNPKEN